LLEAVLDQNDYCTEVSALPDPAVDPEEELTVWVGEHLERVRDMRPLLIQAISELDERPEVAEFACRGRDEVHDILTRYCTALQRDGRADAEADVFAAVTMLISSVMGDAMGRSMVPDEFPPSDEAPRRYVRCFLRAIGVSSLR
jgi:hypothetical protein